MTGRLLSAETIQPTAQKAPDKSNVPRKAENRLRKFISIKKDETIISGKTSKIIKEQKVHEAKNFPKTKIK